MKFDPQQVKKILIVRFSSIGDIILCTPIIRVAKKQFPEAEIHFATKAKFAAILTGNPYITCVHVLENSLARLITELKVQHFDFVIDLHHNLRTLQIKRALKAKHASFPKLNFQKWLWVNLKLNLMPNLHIVDRYFSAAKPLGISYDGLGLDYFGHLGKHPSLELELSKYQDGFVCFAIGGQFETKKLPLNKLLEFCEVQMKPVILIGGPEDEHMAEQVIAGSRKKILSFCGRTNIAESAFIMSKSFYVITHDTGMMHIAAALDLPTVSVWGNTTPLLGMSPLYSTNSTNATISKVLEQNSLRCRPCSKLGKSSCPKEHFRCMQQQNAQNSLIKE